MWFSQGAQQNFNDHIFKYLQHENSFNECHWSINTAHPGAFSSSSSSFTLRSLYVVMGSAGCITLDVLPINSTFPAPHTFNVRCSLMQSRWAKKFLVNDSCPLYLNLRCFREILRWSGFHFPQTFKKLLPSSLCTSPSFSWSLRWPCLGSVPAEMSNLPWKNWTLYMARVQQVM